MTDAYSFDTMVNTPSSLGPDSSLAPPGLSGPTYPGMHQDAEQARQATDKAIQTIQQTAQIQKDKAAALQPMREDLAKANAQPIPQPPTPQKPPPAPTQEDAMQSSPNQEWLTAMLFLGTLGGALTRRPVTNALAAWGGMMKGIEEGQKDKFDASMKTWEAENKRVQEMNKEANDAYLNILKSRDLSIEQKTMAIQIKAAQYDDQATAQLAEGKQYEAVAKLIDERIRYGQMAAKANDGAKIDAAKGEADAYVKSEAGQRYVKAVAEGSVPWPSPNQRSPAVYYRNQAVIDAALQQGGDANKYNAQRAAITARARLEANREVPMEMAIRNANAIIPQLIEASNKVARTTWVTPNKLMQTAANEISDPDVKVFQTLNLEFANLMARTMNPTGVVRVDDREKQLQILLTADSPQTYLKNIQTLRGLLDREWGAILQQKKGAPLEGVYWPTAPEPQTGEQAFGTAAGKANTAVDQTFPGAQQAWERAHPKAPVLFDLPAHLQQWLGSAPPGTKITPMPAAPATFDDRFTGQP